VASETLMEGRPIPGLEEIMTHQPRRRGASPTTARLPRLPNAGARKVAQYAQEIGYKVDVTEGSHLRFRHPVTGAIVVASTTPRRAGYSKTFSQLKRGLPPDHPDRDGPTRRA
jgi:predicted RNA binding protein YcfA (HicA-like mRNA interferase family)